MMLVSGTDSMTWFWFSISVRGEDREKWELTEHHKLAIALPLLCSKAARSLHAVGFAEPPASACDSL